MTDHKQYCGRCFKEVPNKIDHGAELYFSEETSGLDHQQLCPECADPYIGGEYALPGNEFFQEYVH